MQKEQEVSFNQEVREALKEAGKIIFRLRGISLSEIGRKDARFEDITRDPSILEYFPDIGKLRSKELEVAINLEEPRQEVITPIWTGRDIVYNYSKFSSKISEKFPGAKAISGDAVDYADLNDQVGRDLFDTLDFRYFLLMGKVLMKGFYRLMDGRDLGRGGSEVDEDYFRGTGVAFNIGRKVARVGMFYTAGDAGTLRTPEPFYHAFIAPLIIPANLHS